MVSKMNREQKRLQLQQKIAESEKTIAECELKIMDIEDEELLEQYEMEFEESPKQERQPKNCPIWKMKNFKKYSLRRTYDEETKLWSTSDNTQGRTLYLPFQSLITTIIHYQQGIPYSTTFKQVDHHLKSSHSIQTWVYMYRAGAFNDEIRRLAPKYGYNADELISRECDEIEMNSNTSQGVLI